MFTRSEQDIFINFASEIGQAEIEIQLVCEEFSVSNIIFQNRSKLQRNENRDISEVIALGVPNPRTSNEVQYDQRLFNQSKVQGIQKQHVLSVDMNIVLREKKINVSQIWINLSKVCWHNERKILQVMCYNLAALSYLIFDASKMKQL